MSGERKTGAPEPPADPAGPEPGLRGARALGVFAAVAVAFTAVDLVTKYLAFSRIAPGRVVEVIPGVLDFLQSQNQGAAFGILGGAFYFFVAVSIAALAVLAYFSWTAVRSGPGYQVMLGLVAAGVIGNLYDRLKFHHVRDFIDVYISQRGAAQWLVDRFGTNHWPTFNVADACICIGTALLLVKFWRDDKATRAERRRCEPAHAAR